MHGVGGAILLLVLFEVVHVCRALFGEVVVCLQPQLDGDDCEVIERRDYKCV